MIALLLPWFHEAQRQLQQQGQPLRFRSLYFSALDFAVLGAALFRKRHLRRFVCMLPLLPRRWIVQEAIVTGNFFLERCSLLFTCDTSRSPSSSNHNPHESSALSFFSAATSQRRHFSVRRSLSLADSFVCSSDRPVPRHRTSACRVWSPEAAGLVRQSLATSMYGLRQSKQKKHWQHRRAAKANVLPMLLLSEKKPLPRFLSLVCFIFASTRPPCSLQSFPFREDFDIYYLLRHCNY